MIKDHIIGAQHQIVEVPHLEVEDGAIIITNGVEGIMWTIKMCGDKDPVERLVNSHPFWDIQGLNLNGSPISPHQTVFFHLQIGMALRASSFLIILCIITLREGPTLPFPIWPPQGFLAPNGQASWGFSKLSQGIKRQGERGEEPEGEAGTSSKKDQKYSW